MIDISGVSYLLPIFSFVLVFVIIFAILKKTELLGDNNFTMAIVALIFGLIFISFSDVRTYIEAVSPWFVVLVVLMFFVLFLGGFMLAKDVSKIAHPATAWVFIGLLALVFVIIGYYHFNVSSTGLGHVIREFFRHEKYYGSVVLGAVALVVAFIITAKVKD